MALNLNHIRRKKTTLTLGGSDFVFTELTLGDMGEFRAWVNENRDKTREARRTRLLADAEAIGDVDPLKLLEALDRPPTEEDYDAQAETSEGLLYLACLSLKHEEPRWSVENVGQCVTPADLPDIVKAMFPPAPDGSKKKPASLKEKRSRGVLRRPSSSGSTKGRSSGKTSRT